MSSYIIKGGNKLEGEVNISGSKNAALPIIAASILNGGITMKGISVKDFTIEQIDKAQSLLEDVERAERELNNFMETNSSLQDLETVRVLQEEIQYRYLKYLDYIGLNENKFLN